MQYQSVFTARVMPRALQRTGLATWRCTDAGSTRAAWRPTLVSGLQGTLVVNGPPPERFFVGMCRAPRDDMLPDVAAARDARVLDCTMCSPVPGKRDVRSSIVRVIVSRRCDCGFQLRMCGMAPNSIPLPYIPLQSISSLLPSKCSVAVMEEHKGVVPARKSIEEQG